MKKRGVRKKEQTGTERDSERETERERERKREEMVTGRRLGWRETEEDVGGDERERGGRIGA